MASTEDQLREHRIKNFRARAEPTKDGDFPGEKTILITYNGRQEYPFCLSPAEARKVFELLREEFGLT